MFLVQNPFKRLLTRSLHSSPIACLPRIPKPKAPSTAYVKPKMEELSVPNPIAISSPTPSPSSSSKPFTFLTKEKRLAVHLEKRPLPTTFGPGESFSSYTTRPQKPDSTTGPYQYYEVTLKRGTIGLTHSVKKTCTSLGLSKRGQVNWVRIHPTTAGMILKIKELVTVRLVNCIPEKTKSPTGFKKGKSVIGLSL